MALPQSILQRGSRASQPAASAVAEGTLYCVTDENYILEQSVASSWVDYSPTGGSGTVTNTGTLTANALILGNGGVDVTPMASLGTTTTVLHGNAAGAPTFGAIVSADLPTAVKTRAITFAIDGGGVALTTGVKADVYVPYACTITAVTMLADQSGSCVVDIWKDTYANYPPTVADTITASAKPTISAATKSQDTTLTGWTTSISASDTLRFNIDSASTLTRLVLTLTVTV